ncbi:MAG: metallophosphoesterase, partial [candidate division Zixibacteria bacterium]|nr:metallophosphoesterase [candidate division Zixibacteria bacterium]
LALTASLSSYGLWAARRRPAVKNVTVELAELPPEFEGFRIAQITDLHVGPTIKRDWMQSVVDETNALNADIIAVTGDLVDGTVDSLRNDVAPIGELKAPSGVFFVTGNHEYYSGVIPWIDEVRRLGLTVLLNEHHVIERNGARMMLAGVTDYHGGGFKPDHTSDPHGAMANSPACNPKLLLAHQPNSIFAAADAGYDLQISGHTHGGQFFPGNWLARMAQPYIRGLHKHDKTWIYVSCGTGYWGPPLRVGAPSEITLITLKRA